jgi:hypothetical protein
MKYINRQSKLRGCAGSCGFISVINLLKWLDYSVSYKEFTKDIPTEILGGGMYNNEMESLLRRWGVKKIRKHKEFPTVKRIERILDEDRAIILGYYWIDYVSKRNCPARPHFAFIHGHNDKDLFIENKLHVPSKKFLQYSLDEGFRLGFDDPIIYSFSKKSS